jgi:single-strand DNA-binding protein
LRKGSLLFVEGRLQTRSWEAQDGQKKYRTEIIIDTFQFGPKGSGTVATTNNPRPNSTPTSSSKSTPNNSPQEELPTVTLDEDEIDLEEIPF